MKCWILVMLMAGKMIKVIHTDRVSIMSATRKTQLRCDYCDSSIRVSRVTLREDSQKLVIYITKKLKSSH